jgi:hypothetical protein
MKKLIKKDYFNAISNYLSDNAIDVIGEAKDQVITLEMALTFLDNEIELLSKKNSGSANRKMTPQQETNENLKSAILDSMVAGNGYTITEIMALDDVAEIGAEILEKTGSPLTNQRVSALVRQMLDETEDNSDESKPIYKRVEKRKSLFFLK